MGGLVEALGLIYSPVEWRLFINLSSKSLKAVLLNIGSKLTSVAVAHSVQLTENYENMKILLSSLKYRHHNWKILYLLYLTFVLYLIYHDILIVSFRFVSQILGIQGGYTKYPCFLCLWDSRADDKHYTQNEWLSRKTLQPDSHNVVADPLVKPHQILLPSLHIKLGLMKNFVKAINKKSPAFAFIKQTFPQVTDAKLNAGFFDGPRIRTLMKDGHFNGVMNEPERNTWQAFKSVVSNFLGKKKVQNTC